MYVLKFLYTADYLLFIYVGFYWQQKVLFVEVSTNLVKMLKRLVYEAVIKGEDVKQDEARFILSLKELQIQLN